MKGHLPASITGTWWTAPAQDIFVTINTYPSDNIQTPGNTSPHLMTMPLRLKGTLFYCHKGLWVVPPSKSEVDPIPVGKESLGSKNG